MKYWLCFGFENHANRELEKFHVTMIYFGELETEAMADVIDEVDFYIRQISHYIEPFFVKFNRSEMFGIDKTIPVLLPSHEHNPKGVEYNFMKRLRELLGRFIADGVHKFDFNPHLTTDMKYFEGKINRLCLCSNSYKIEKVWHL
jgi:2'-5' RNA ligase